MQRSITIAATVSAAFLSCSSIAAPCDTYPQKLGVMASADQALRERLDFSKLADPAQKKLAEQMGIVDRSNAARVKALFAECGFPDKERHGEQAQRDAWLLVQHADHDLALQKHTLKLLEEMAARRGEPMRPSFAYLADRIAVAEKRPQLYGTQLTAPAEKACQFDFDPMDDRGKVEQRRAALGLPPLEDYKRAVLEMSNCALGKHETPAPR